MNFVAIGNTGKEISFEGSYESIKKATELLTKKYGEFMEFPIELDENGNVAHMYINNDSINICILNAELLKDEHYPIWETIDVYVEPETTNKETQDQ